MSYQIHFELSPLRNSRLIKELKYILLSVKLTFEGSSIIFTSSTKSLIYVLKYLINAGFKILGLECTCYVYVQKISSVVNENYYLFGQLILTGMCWSCVWYSFYIFAHQKNSKIQQCFRKSRLSNKVLPQRLCLLARCRQIVVTSIRSNEVSSKDKPIPIPILCIQPFQFCNLFTYPLSYKTCKT